MAINGEPTVVSTFAGTGGSSLGYHWAGFKELLAIDFDEHAVECFKLNFPNVRVWHKSVTEVTGADILRVCDLKEGELDVFDGSPPCQGFSTAGKREVHDPRNDLFKHYWRLVTEIQPKVFVMENVTGMAKGPMKGRFIEIMKTLKAGNYEVKCKQMNAMYYGVPQARERLIFIGVRKDLNKYPSFPIPSGSIVTVKDVLPYVEKHSRGQFDKKFKFSDTPAYTITKTASMEFLVDGQKRKPKIEELLKLASFPDDWKLSGSYIDQYARIGNAVMPKFMQAIAETIKKDILEL